MTRFRPSRAGLINIWDYVDEEFVFADGRLVLRGHNGSGKTKALEVLFPFILDGVADARRLDPFSGENRTMKSNLLYRGQDAEYGFVWMEFANGDCVVTLIIALRAHKDRPAASPSFFVTRQRIGVDFGLLTRDSRPLTERQLEQLLGAECRFTSATDYRAAIDAMLFGLGPQRYTQLIDLLLALRRPLLAKDLDPEKVSATLTAGLSPVSDDLIAQAALDFENLAAVQKLVDDLIASDEAARDFLAVYSDYLRGSARHHLDWVDSRRHHAMDAAAALRASIIETARASTAEQAAKAVREQANQRRIALTGTLNGLKQDDAYQGQTKLDLLRTQVSSGGEELTKMETAAGKLATRVSTLRHEAEEVEHRIDRHRGEAAQEAAAQELAARAAGIEHDDADQPTVKARATARQEDIRQVRQRLADLDTALQHQQRADADLSTADTKLEQAEQECEQAVQAEQRARADANHRLHEWAARWTDDKICSSSDFEALSTALAAITGPGSPALTTLFTDLTEERRTHLLTSRADTRRDLRDHQQRHDQLCAERDLIAAEQDDAPTLPATRDANRTGRPGAPLWQLVRFVDDLDSTRAAAIEAALEAAGLLTAWLHPDPAMTTAALQDGGNDAYLLPLPVAARPAGPALADVLLPERESHVPDEIVSAVLHSISLDPAASFPAVGSDGRFNYGIHVGSYAKPIPEFIGATYRAQRRAQRIAEFTRQIDEYASMISNLEIRLVRLDDQLGHFRLAKAELPSIVPILTALNDVEAASRQLATARGERAEAAAAADSAIAATDAARRRLRQGAGERGLPTEAEPLDLVEAAVADYLASGERRHARLAEAATTQTDLRDRTRLIADLEADQLEAAEELQIRQERQIELERELAALEERLGAPLREVLVKIEKVEGELREVVKTWQTADETVDREHDALIAARSTRGLTEEAAARAIATLLETARAIAPFVEPELRSVLGVTSQTTWPHPAQWPDPEASRLAQQLTTAEPAEVIEKLIPDTATELLAVLGEATRDGRAGESARKQALQRLSEAYKNFSDILEAREQDYRADWQPGETVITVHIFDADGNHPLAEFAARTAERAEEQRILLEDRERTVLEDELLGSLAQQIFDRVFFARELVKGMDTDTRSRPMSNGTQIGIRWVAATKITDLQREVSALLAHSHLGPGQLADLRSLLRHMLHDYRAAHPRATYREALFDVLDYRAWHAFELRHKTPGQEEVKLTRKQHSLMSGGEKSAAIHLPLFAAANALYSSAEPDCPRMIALDEAFAGIDDRYKPDLLGLTVQYGLDTFMTGHDLWVRYDTVPAAAHYDMHSDKLSHTVSAVLILWDGAELIDAGDGFSGNEDLAAELLGFTPTRHTPVDDTGLLDLDTL